MAELLIGPLVSLLKDKVSSYLLDQYKVMQGMEEQRQILARRLPAILDFIDEAESAPSRPGVSSWLQALKKVSYEAIDVFDEFKYEALRRDACKKGHYNTLGVDLVSLFPSRNPIVFRYRMGKKLRKIVQNIEILVKEMNDFGFIQRLQQQAPRSNQWRKTVSVMVDSDKDVVSRSREEEKRRIIKILLDGESSSDLLVLPIVGVGGLGKTTFVQLIYNDPVIKNHFELCRWCCVSDDFDVGNIARNICHTNEQVCEKALQDLQKEVSGKRYLIVLDDVWNRDPDEWGKLKTCLKQGGQGSVVLTTTRDAEVARIMTTALAEAYNLEKLGENYLKEIIKTRAFSLQKLNSDEVEDIIDKIVGRCDGSPLAAKAFGSMLSTKTSVREWNDILTRSNICADDKNRVLPILKLSYDDLPSHMKLCFAFCALFPKDYEIDVDTLIQLWMAHDFIPAQDKEHPETTARQTFMELTWRSFFQDVRQTSPMMYGQRKQLRSRTICKIHDLLHDGALSVMGKECVTITYSWNQKNLWSSDARSFFSESSMTKDSYDFLKKQSSTLRTLLYTYEYHSGFVTYLSNYKSLRALQLRNLGEHLLRTSHLKHLRYLNFSGNDQIRQLPEEVSSLYNLQTLDLSYCKKLYQLPKGMKYMIGLQHLYTNGCRSLSCLPADMGQLTSLQTLTYFVAGGGTGCSTVKELGMLDLGGELELHGLENVSEGHAKGARLENKENLTHLSLEWTESQNASAPDSQQKVLDALKPHGRLEMLRIAGYEATGLPKWVTDLILLQHLTELHLVGFTSCEEFPQFCHFRALQVLYLEKMDRLQNLCSDPSCLPFPALKELRLRDLDSLERWAAIEGKEVTLPVLETVDIRNCPKLTSLPEAPKLKSVQVNEGKPQLSLLIVNSGYMSSLSKLTLSAENTEATLDLDSENHDQSPLTELSLDGCDFFFMSSSLNLTTGVWKCFGKLVDLTIEHSDVLIHWPEEVFQSLVLLKKLEVNSCEKLIGPAKVNGGQIPTPTTNPVLPHLKIIIVFYCDSLVELFVLPPSLEFISISFCNKLELIWGKPGRQFDTFTCLDQPRHSNASDSVVEQSSSQANHPTPCLRDLVVTRCGTLVALPNLPPSLGGLSLFGCQELCSITGQMSALESLCIYGCNELQSLDSFADLPSLVLLNLERCKRLTSLPGVAGSYPALRQISVKHCPAIDMKPLYKHHQQRLDSLVERDLSHAHSSDPREGVKLREPKSWKYAIPGCRGRAIRRHGY